MNNKLLAVAAVVGLLAYLFWPRKSDLRHDVSSDVQTCKSHMMAIYKGLASQARTGEVDLSSGYDLVAGLLEKDLWERTPENLAKLTCPGPGATPVPEGALALPGTFGPETSAYACRDMQAHPLQRFPSGGENNEPLLACDNASGMNHDGVMNVLYTDGTVLTLHVAREIELGRLPAGTTLIEVGPGSPHEDLRKQK